MNSIRSRSLRNCYTILPSFGPWMAATYGALTWKPSQGTTVPNYTTWWTEAHWC